MTVKPKLVRASRSPVMIEVCGLTKRYGRVLAVDALSFDVRPGL